MYPLTSFVGFMQQSLLFCLPITWLNIRSSDKLVCYYTQGFDSLWQAFQLLLFCPQLKPHCVHLNLSFPGLIAQRYVCVCVCGSGLDCFGFHRVRLGNLNLKGSRSGNRQSYHEAKVLTIRRCPWLSSMSQHPGWLCAPCQLGLSLLRERRKREGLCLR